MGPWAQGLFGTHSSFTHLIAEQKCVCGNVWGDPVPTNCRVLKADGHFTVARTLLNLTISYGFLGPRAIWYT